MYFFFFFTRTIHIPFPRQCSNCFTKRYFFGIFYLVHVWYGHLICFQIGQTFFFYFIIHSEWWYLYGLYHFFCSIQYHRLHFRIQRIFSPSGQRGFDENVCTISQIIISNIHLWHFSLNEKKSGFHFMNRIITFQNTDSFIEWRNDNIMRIYTRFFFCLCVSR